MSSSTQKARRVNAVLVAVATRLPWLWHVNPSKWASPHQGEGLWFQSQGIQLWGSGPQFPIRKLELPGQVCMNMSQRFRLGWRNDSCQPSPHQS